MDENTFWIKVLKVVFTFIASVIITVVLSYHMKGLIAMRMGYHEEPVRNPSVTNGTFQWTK